MMKKFLFLAVISTLLFLAACGSESSTSDESSGSDSGQSETNENKSEKEADQSDKVYGVGDTVNLGDAEVTFTKVYYAEANEFMEAENGKVLAVDFEAKNTGDDSLYIGVDEFTISVDGTQYSEYMSGDGFMNENISSGNSISGTMKYDVPESETYKIIYEPTFTLSSDTVEFEVSPE